MIVALPALFSYPFLDACSIYSVCVARVVRGRGGYSLLIGLVKGDASLLHAVTKDRMNS